MTEQQRVQDALREAEERARRIVEEAHEAFVSIDASGLITDWNPSAEALFGWSHAEAVGRSLAETIIPERYRAAHHSGLERFLATGEGRVLGQRLELVALRRDGSEFPVELTISATKGVDGWAFNAFLHDISDRLRAFEDRERLAAIVESSHEAIIGKDLEGTITAWNRGAAEIFGYSAEEAIGRPISLIVPPEQRGELETNLAQIAEDKQVSRLETVRIRKDGELINTLLTLSPVHDRDGQVVGIAGMSRDITERKRSEERLREVKRQLAERNEDLERSNEELAQFAFVASHDLQEPLRVIEGFVELLARRYEGRLDEDADRFIAATVSGVERMQALIDALLSYSRVGRAEPVRQAVDTADLVIGITESLRPAIEEREAEVVIDELPTVQGDRILLEQMFQNLISNALKFTDREDPRVEIGAERENGDWKFSVKDNGPGIEPRSAERIFEMFKRLHGRSVSGTGIGLAICKRIAERHGGRIWVESVPGEGSDFNFTVPDSSPSQHAAPEG